MVTVALVFIGAICLTTGCGKKETGVVAPVQNSVLDLTGVPPEIIASLPPDPGEKGKETIEGVNANNDPAGLRDDVERYIIVNYYNQPKVQEAVTRYAQVMQNAIRDISNQKYSKAQMKATAVENGRESFVLGECIGYTFGTDDKWKIRDAIQDVIFNTDARIIAYLAYDEQLGGEYYRGLSNHELTKVCDSTATSTQQQ